jgi:hypothetical protein
MVSATVLTLVVVPAIYGLWQGWGLENEPREPESAAPEAIEEGRKP